MLKHTAVVRPSGWRRKASKERCFMAGLCHCVLCKDTDQFSAVCLPADDGLHDELPKGSALNAVNTEGYRNDEFKAIHIIADAVVLPDMTAYTLLFQNAILEYSLDSLAHIAAEHIIHVGNLLHGHPYSIGRHGYRSALADSYNSPVHFPIVFSFDNLFLSRLAISLSMSFEIFCSVTCA